MHLIHGTIAATNTAQPIVPGAVVPDRIGPFQLLLPQNNGSHNMRFGDSSISSTQGLLLYPSSATNPGITPIYPSLAYSGDLSEFWILGTQNDTYDILILD